MKFAEKKISPRSRFLNDDSLKRLITADILVLILLNIPVPGGCTFCAVCLNAGMLSLAIYISISTARSIKALNQVLGVWKSWDGLTSVVMLILVGSGFTALVALDQSIPALWRLG